MKKARYIYIIFGLILLLSGCTESPLPDNLSDNPALYEKSDALDYYELNLSILPPEHNYLADGFFTWDELNTLDGRFEGKDIEVSWSRSESGNLKIDKGSPHSVNDSETITLYRPNYETDYVYLSGSLKDKDAFGNDNLGSRTLKINLNDINKNRPSDKNYTHRLNFDEMANHEVRVYYDVLRVK